jgi:short-subunit dehydrogenase
MMAREVAEIAYRGTQRGEAVVVTGVRNRLAAMLGRYLPRRWTAAVVRRIQLARMVGGAEP